MEISAMDKEFFVMARQHIAEFRAKWAHAVTGRVLEIGPEHDVWPGAETMGLNEGCTWVADITRTTPIPDSTYDFVFCMEVLEHTCQPFDAIAEIRRIMKDGGRLLLSGPWNFRYHGPIPDNFRISEHGWKTLLKDWSEVRIEPLETPERWLMPIHLNVSARCNKEKSVNAWELNFQYIR